MASEMAASWQRLLREQHQWIRSHGGDRIGYRANYGTEHGRTVTESDAIYDADMAELARIERRQPRPKLLYLDSPIVQELTQGRTVDMERS